MDMIPKIGYYFKTSYQVVGITVYATCLHLASVKPFVEDGSFNKSGVRENSHKGL